MENDKFQELVLEQFKILAEGQKSLADGQTRLEDRIGNLEQGQKKLEQGQQHIETRIENDVIEKIRALFDDRSVNQDYFVSIRDAIARTEETGEITYRRLIDLDVKLGGYDRELRLLRAEKK